MHNCTRNQFNKIQIQVKSVRIKHKELKSMKATVNWMGYRFFQEYIATFQGGKYTTIVLLYNDNEVRNELLSFISFLD